MLTLYRTPEDELGLQIENKLRDIVIAHNVKIIHTREEIPDDMEYDSLPVLIDNGNCISGETELIQHIEVLKKLMKDWDKFQSDACFMDDDGRIC